MAAAASDSEQLERHLLMQGLGALEAGRSRCRDCGRSPLVGEQVHLYDTRPPRPPDVVCELCSQLREGPPLWSETVHHAEHGQTVRLTRRIA